MSAQQHLWLWQSVAIIIYCFSFCLWTLPSVFLRDWVNTRWTIWSISYQSEVVVDVPSLWLWRSVATIFSCLFLWLHYPQCIIKRVQVNTQSTLSHVKQRFCLVSSSFGCDGNSWSNDFTSLFWICILRIPGMGGAELFPAGRGKDENPRGGAKMKIRGAVRGGAGQKSA